MTYEEFKKKVDELWSGGDTNQTFLDRYRLHRENPEHSLRYADEKHRAEVTPRSAIAELLALTECQCDPAYTARRLHESSCAADYRVEVECLAELVERMEGLES